MPGFVGCLDCPFRDRPEVCHALASGHRPLCRPEFAAMVKARTLGQKVHSRPVRHSPPPVVPLTISVAVIRCEHRTKLPACGCVGKWRCERDQRDVTWAECVVCKTAEADSTS